MYFRVELRTSYEDYVYKIKYTIYQEEYCVLPNVTEAIAKEFILKNIRDTDIVDYLDTFSYNKELLTGVNLKERCLTWNS